MQLNKEYLIIAGSAALFLIYYIFGWFCDKNFRLVMRKSKLSPFKKIFLHFRGSKMKENRGHAIVCIKFEEFAFLNLILGVLCFAAVKITGQQMVFLGSAALLGMSFAGFAFQAYMNIGKYQDRKKQTENMDETGFEDYRVTASAVQTEEKKPTSYPSIKKSDIVDSDNRIDSLASGREYMKNKGLLDDDIFSPFVADAVDKFKGNSINGEFSEGTDIEKGKEALKDFAGKQLNTEFYRNVNNFEKPVNSYSSAPSEIKAEKESARTVQDIISEHKQDINPENKFKAVNNYSPVRKDDNK